MSQWSELVACPPPSAINSGLRPCPTQALIHAYGMPRWKLTDDCLPVTSHYWKSKMTLMNLGPFRATGHHLFLAALAAGLKAVKAQEPTLYAALGSAGCLCCRLVRGSANRLSNHGLGMAIDLTIDGKLDIRDDDKCQRGLLRLYEIFKSANCRFWWGAEFNVEDAMHFEASSELVKAWGLL